MRGSLRQVGACKAGWGKGRDAGHQPDHLPPDDPVLVVLVPEDGVRHLPVAGQHELPRVSQQLPKNQQAGVDHLRPHPAAHISQLAVAVCAAWCVSGTSRRRLQPAQGGFVELVIPLHAVPRLPGLHHAQALPQCVPGCFPDGEAGVTQRRPDAVHEGGDVHVEHRGRRLCQLAEDDDGCVASGLQLRVGAEPAEGADNLSERRDRVTHSVRDTGT